MEKWEKNNSVTSHICIRIKGWEERGEVAVNLAGGVSFFELGQVWMQRKDKQLLFEYSFQNRKRIFLFLGSLFK